MKVHLFRIKIAAAVLQVRAWSKIITLRISSPPYRAGFTAAPNSLASSWVMSPYCQMFR